MSDNLQEGQFSGYIPPVKYSPVPSGLRYRSAPHHEMRRAYIEDTSVPPRQAAAHRGSGEHDYWSPEIRQTKTAQGKPLKTPKTWPNPNVSNPHTVAFSDFHEPDEGLLYLDYTTVRPDQTGRGHARRLIEDIAAQHPQHALDFGKVMHPGIWRVRESLAERGRKVYGSPEFDR